LAYRPETDLNRHAKYGDAMLKLASGMSRLGTESAFEVLARAKALEARESTSSIWE